MSTTTQSSIDLVRLKEYPVTIPLPSSSVSGFIFTMISVRETLCASSVFGATLGTVERKSLIILL